jgi:DNA-binding HxlR family transcriptional regulator
VIGGLMLFWLKHRTMRFTEFRRRMPDAMHKVLWQQTRELERTEIITRQVYPEIPPKLEFAFHES